MSVAKFYGLALTKDNKSVRIGFEHMGENQPKTRLQAMIAAKKECEKKGITYQDVRPVGLQEKRGNTLTKFYKRRQLTGSNGKDFSKAL